MRLFAPKRTLPISLHLLEPTIYLEPTGDHPSVLRGVLNVSSKEFMKRIKTVHLCIKGRLITCSSKFIFLYCRQLITQRLCRGTVYYRQACKLLPKSREIRL